MFYCFIWQGGTRRDVKLINRPWHVGPKSPFQQQQQKQQLGNWELQQQTHTRTAESWAACCECVRVCILQFMLLLSLLLLLLFNFSLFQTLTHRHNSHIDTRLFANQLARCKICYSIFEKTLLLCAYAKWLATTTINNHFFPYSKIYFKWEYQQQKTHTRWARWVSGASQVNFNVNNKTHDRAERDCETATSTSSSFQNRKQKSARTFSLLLWLPVLPASTKLWERLN